MSLYMIFATTARAKNEIKTHVSGGLRWAEKKALPDPTVWQSKYSNVGVVFFVGFRSGVQRQHLRPDAMDGILTVPLKDYGYSPGCKCTQYSLQTATHC